MWRKRRHYPIEIYTKIRRIRTFVFKVVPLFVLVNNGDPEGRDVTSVCGTERRGAALGRSVGLAGGPAQTQCAPSSPQGSGPAAEWTISRSSNMDYLHDETCRAWRSTSKAVHRTHINSPSAPDRRPASLSPAESRAALRGAHRWGLGRPRGRGGEGPGRA